MTPPGASAGAVYLVGAGPGDPELLTLKGRRLLGAADAVFYDALANPALLEFAPPAAERVPVGKRSGGPATAQAAIIAAMVERARRGWRVVRLKGGDPFVFGRGGEELLALRRAGVACEVVPGISAANGAAAAAGIPLTHRGLASGVRLVAGHAAGRDGGAEMDGEGTGGENTGNEDTLVVYMGLERLGTIAGELLRQGRAPATPAAVVARATLPDQQVIAGTLATIAALAAQAAVASPALIIVGAVAGWAAPGPLESAPQASARPAPEAPPGIILLAHGSPLPGWQAEVDQLARSVALPGQFVHSAYLPPSRPSLADAVDAAARAAVRRLVVVPYFLAAGLHVTRDLPALVAAEQRRHPGLRLRLAPCLAGHPALRAAILDRVAGRMDDRVAGRMDDRIAGRMDDPAAELR